MKPVHDGPNLYEWRRPDGTVLMQYWVAPHLDLGRGWMPNGLERESEVHCFRRQPNKPWALKLIWNKAGVVKI